MLELNNIIKKYGNVKAVDGISFKADSKNIFGLLGPNGAGKTTTIRMIMGIIEPDEGNITLNKKEIDEKLKLKLGYLPEDRGLYQKQECEQIIRYFASLRGMDQHTTDNQLKYWLDRFELWKSKNRKVEELSKGNQQKIQFILSIIHNPSLLILDEPFTGLDPVNQILLKEIINEKSDEGKTIIFSTHQMEQVEKLCDNICLINNGKIILNGNLEEIRSNQHNDQLMVKYGGHLEESEIIKFFQNFENNGSTFKGNLKISTKEFLPILNDLVDIRSYSLETDSLEKIFIKAVKEKS